MLRPTEYGLIWRSNSRRAFLLLAAALQAGCTMSVPMRTEENAPAMTGSLGPAVDVERPLPHTLAYSDASKIGQTAAVALWQADASAGAAIAEWINAATGSSGTLEDGGAGQGADNGKACRLFRTTVTSFEGVHRYAGKVCRSGSGRSLVHIVAPEGSEAS